MAHETKHAHRKDEHLALAEHFYNAVQRNDFDQLHLIFRNLPELGVQDVSLETTIFDQKIAAPIYINAMTGGSSRTGAINEKLAQIAADLRIPMAVGSESIILSEPESLETFSVVRKVNPTGVIFANIGAGKDLAAAKQVVAAVAANALQVHLNVLQEIVMPEGDRDFHWAEMIREYQHLDVPIIAKEVGFGMSEMTISQLEQLGIRYIDLGGAGGTNFVQIENARRQNHDMAYLAEQGLSTVKSLLESQPFQRDQHLTFFASGGVRQPLDIVKAWHLGAKYVGISRTILHLLLHHTVSETETILTAWLEQLRLLLVAFGVRTPAELPQVEHYFDQELYLFQQQRQS
ncbi:type 2 isopentenyl-diphosphate Delta-isomerase [Agrilactobacillus fermenti]|uniref:type 2 isopentenyl-diphosphate Delta-isomerase n=1 Tax=Agrilactobacillus fermenti TaxID=2586909 RepID=UPI001E31A83E|nr:type 2 isopentenyl-diphosphate Delta-isomerase [Agrilactobacillus fermenti]MCD2255838.1 type 2 isopentenyl-diphosphate Delta-isomerase [Agrilactobacillus fermenti]